MALRSFQEVEDWVARNGGVDALRKAAAEGRFDRSSSALLHTWLATKAADEIREEEHARRAAEQQLGARSTEAAERSAAAAERSADAAAMANRVAWLALLVALAALLVTAWPHFTAAS